MEFMEDGTLKEIYGKSEYIGMYEVDENHCDCTANKNYLICRHTLYYREEYDLEPFEEAMFPKVYIKHRLEVESEDEEQEYEAEPGNDRSRTPSPGLVHIRREENNARNKTPGKVKFNQAYESYKLLPETMV